MPAWGIRTALTALRSFMETDAKGQLGGLECTKAERERLAERSAEWKCGVCGRSNGEILKEVEEAAKSKEVEVVEVPKELKMGWKDEMVPEKAEAAMLEAELAEGFVQTGNPSGESTPPVASSSSTYPPARPAQSVPLPTATVSRRAPTHVPFVNNAYQAQVVQRRSNNGVPMWIDRTIAAVVVCLVAMVFKVLLGL
jgi:ubiquitin-conjugating enzyme E2 J1